MYINKSKISESRGCNCGPTVNDPSLKGPSYWKIPDFVPSINKAKAFGNTKTPGTNILYQGTIKHCVRKYMYLWLKNGSEFWSVPIFSTSDCIYVWIWSKDRWTYYMMPLENIDCFMCY